MSTVQTTLKNIKTAERFIGQLNLLLQSNNLESSELFRDLMNLREVQLSQVALSVKIANDQMFYDKYIDLFNGNCAEIGKNFTRISAYRRIKDNRGRLTQETRLQSKGNKMYSLLGSIRRAYNYGLLSTFTTFRDFSQELKDSYNLTWFEVDFPLIHIFQREIDHRPVSPFTMKKEINEILQETGWVEGKISSLDPSLLDRMVRRRE